MIAYALDRRMIDTAVLTDQEDLVPVPRLVSRAEDVASCATSKYTAAPTLAALNRAVRDGYKKIGVVGTPCQVTAVAQMRTNPLGKPDFIDPVALVVGLFCTWALDTRKFLRLLSKHLDLRQVRKMDIPPPPAEVLVIERDDGKMEIPLSEIRPLVPRGCAVCPDMTAEWADLSVGILEGDPCWNTLIIRTEKGRTLVDRASHAGWLRREVLPSENLAHLRFAAANKKKRSLHAALQEGLVNAEGRSCLRINPRAMETMLKNSS